MTGRRAEARGRNRDALIDAAEQLFAEQGYSDVSVHAIARAAELTSGAIYSIFGSKLDLLFAVLGRRLDGLEAALAELDDDHTAPVSTVLKAYAAEYHRAVVSQDGRRSLRLEVDVLAVLLRDEDKSEDRIRWGIRGAERLGAVLTDREIVSGAERRLTASEAQRLAAAVSALLRGLAQQQALGGSVTTSDEWIDLACALITTVDRS